jgi:hypothetical protein
MHRHHNLQWIYVAGAYYKFVPENDDTSSLFKLKERFQSNYFEIFSRRALRRVVFLHKQQATP